MKILTTPERLVLSTLYCGGKKTFDQIVPLVKLSVIDCFNILQRLIIKNLINYSSGLYFLDQSNISEVKSLLQIKKQQHLEIEQIIRTTFDNNNDSAKLKEIQCSDYDLKILRHYFGEIDRFIKKITTSRSPGDKKHYVFWGEQSSDAYIAQIKKNYHKI